MRRAVPRGFRNGGRLLCAWCGRPDSLASPCVSWRRRWVCGCCGPAAVAGMPPADEMESEGWDSPWDDPGGIPVVTDPAPVGEADLFAPFLRHFEAEEGLRRKRRLERLADGR